MGQFFTNQGMDTANGRSTDTATGRGTETATGRNTGLDTALGRGIGGNRAYTAFRALTH